VPLLLLPGRNEKGVVALLGFFSIIGISYKGVKLSCD
jgi:hypothetical protein